MKLTKIITVLALSLITSMLFASVTDVNPLVFATPLVGVGLASVFGIIELPQNVLGLNFGAITDASFPAIDGREAMGGYGSVLYLALHKDISATGWPAQPDIEAVTNVNELALLSGSFTMEDGMYFYKVKVKPGSLKVTPEGQGEVGGHSFRQKGEFFIPGIDADTAGIARLLNNMYGVVIIPDQGGNFRTCYGTYDLPCEFAISGDSGASASDAKGITVSFECDSFVPGWIYNGIIPLSATETVEAVS